MIVSLFPELTQKGFFIINKKLGFVDSRLLNWIHAPTARSKQTRLAALLACTGASVFDSACITWREVNDGGGVLFFTALDRLCVVVDSEDFHITFCYVYNIAHSARVVKGKVKFLACGLFDKKILPFTLARSRVNLSEHMHRDNTLV